METLISQMSVTKTKTQSSNVGPLNINVCNFSQWNSNSRAYCLCTTTIVSCTITLHGLWLAHPG